MNRLARFSCLIMALLFSCAATQVRAESELEGKFQDMFVTAGYSAAAGAAIGAALLTLQDNPGKHLKFISVGASVGFLGGTAFGGWMAIAPMLVENSRPVPTAVAGVKPSQLVIRPWIDTAKHSLAGIEAGAVLAQF